MRKLLALVSAMLMISAVNAGELSKEFNRIADMANIANGDASTSSYDTKKYSWIKIRRELVKDYKPETDEDSECRYIVSGSRRQALELIKDIEQDGGVYERLKRLYKRKKLKSAFLVEWDGDSGDSEYCQINTIFIYGKDGDMLYLEYNHTT